jgi:hypothetical protein
MMAKDVDLHSENVDIAGDLSADSDNTSPADTDNDSTARGLERWKSIDEIETRTSIELGQYF